MKKFLLNIVVFAIIGTVITVPTLILIDRFIYSISQTSSIFTSTPIVSTSSNSFKQVENASEIQYSYDNKYYTFLNDSKIHIYDSTENKEVKVIEDENPICYYNLLYDKNLIIYFTEEKGNTISTLTLKTYEIDTERESDYNKIKVTNFSRVKDISMSPIINIIYVNIETKSGKYTNNLVYRIDLFNSMANIKSGTIYEKMIMLQQKDRVYYEDENSNIYVGSNRLNIFKEKVNMIGVDIADNVYFLSKNNKDVVYKVKNNVIVDKIELTDTDLVSTYFNYEGVYLIYPTYIMEVSADNPYKRVGRISKYFTFEAIKDEIIYLKTNDNLVIKQEMTKY